MFNFSMLSELYKPIQNGNGLNWHFFKPVGKRGIIEAGEQFLRYSKMFNASSKDNFRAGQFILSKFLIRDLCANNQLSNKVHIEREMRRLGMTITINPDGSRDSTRPDLMITRKQIIQLIDQYSALRYKRNQNEETQMATLRVLYDIVKDHYIECLSMLQDSNLRREISAYKFELREHIADIKDSPWVNEPWFDSVKYLLPHPSSKDPNQIAFITSVNKLMHILPDSHPTKAGEQEALYTRTTPGRFLQRIMGDELDSEDIKELSNSYQAKMNSCKFELQILDNNDEAWKGNSKALQDEWYQLYKEVLVDYSCMRNSHGPRAYGLPGNGLGLAYLESYDGTLFMRTIIHRKNPSDQWSFHRVFPFSGSDSLPKFSEEKGRSLFSSYGWEEDTDLQGYKLAKIEHPDGDWCMPYIDGRSQDVDEYPDYFVIDRSGEYSATNTTGTFSTGSICDGCGDHFHEDSMTYIESEDRYVCEGCLDDDYTYAYTRNNNREWFSNSQVVMCESDGDYYHIDYTGDHDVYQCEETGYWYSIDDLETTSRGFIQQGNRRLIELYEEDNDGNEYAHINDTVTIKHPKTGEERTYHIDSEDSIDEWQTECNEGEEK